MAKLISWFFWRLKRGMKEILKLRFKGINPFILGSFGISTYKDVDTLCKNVHEFNSLLPYIPYARAIYRKFSHLQSEKVAPAKFDSAEELAVFLYAFIAEFKPKVVVETGVANGISTNMIMNALEKYEGVLHSFDINPMCETVYNGPGNWEFHLLQKNYSKNLESKTKELKNVTLWIHDSDHSYSWQKFEYKLAYKLLSLTSGVLISDDIDCTTAFGKFSQKNKLKSWAIFDTRKFFAVTKMNT